ncbi:MAG: hypothetical protein ACE5JS_13345 [Nitrospinota bacterium]
MAEFCGGGRRHPRRVDYHVRGGVRDAGAAENLTQALAEQGAKNLVAIPNAAGQRERGISSLFRNNQIQKIPASFPVPGMSDAFEERRRSGVEALISFRKEQYIPPRELQRSRSY